MRTHQTDQCSKFRQPEIQFEAEDSIPDLDTAWMKSALEGMVAAGSRFSAGQTLEMGPNILRFESAEQGQLRLFEPDMQARPIRYVPGVTRTLRMVRSQGDTAESFGLKEQQVFANILPNCMAPVIVQGTLGFSEGILSVAALGFLGLGAKPPTAEWGTMLSDARSFIESAPWLVTLPGLCILVVVLGFNLLGDGLRDALDPRLKR